ncbi:MAG: hypothetical protein VZR25_05530 [Acutalibacteraceae bacterium]|nr:hypothetical protein [Acutalibacteraceae bacterium]
MVVYNGYSDNCATLSHDPFEVGDAVAVSFSLDRAASLPEDRLY